MIAEPSITQESLLELLHERKLYSSIDEQIDFDTPIMLDSLSLVWFVEGLEQRLGIELELDDADYEKFGSVREIYSLLSEKGIILLPEDSQ
ncbi:phosphopantetheine-binding protein [Paenibacillus kobensis]|uniref:phosphopantetheine-binding protein n=1 Tax=Paenibacillus kobensis TaxID=59841 RepID=UPI000FD750FE|nr:phosphopantetheine-binding protein [Paenibacillus kobensis]